MRVQIKRWGRGAGVRIPAPVMTGAQLQIGQFVDIRAEDGRVVIEPVKLRVYDLDELLKAMNPEKFPEEVDFGQVVGRESW